MHPTIYESVQIRCIFFILILRDREKKNRLKFTECCYPCSEFQGNPSIKLIMARSSSVSLIPEKYMATWPKSIRQEFDHAIHLPHTWLPQNFCLPVCFLSSAVFRWEFLIQVKATASLFVRIIILFKILAVECVVAVNWKQNSFWHYFFHWAFQRSVLDLKYTCSK